MAPDPWDAQAAQQESGDNRPQQPCPQRPPPRVAGAPVVLIAEDTFDTRELYELYLTQRGFRVQTVVAGADAFLTKPCLPEDLERQIRKFLVSAPQRTS